MDLITEYRLYAMALYLNMRVKHDINAEHCRLVMQNLAEQAKLTPEYTDAIYEEVSREVEDAFKKLEQQLHAPQLAH